MFGSDILEVAIGLSFVFLLASLIATAAKEGLESLMRKRAEFLKKALGELLNGPSGQPAGGQDWVKRFYTHPLISGLYLGPYDDKKHDNLPSYVPAGTFVSAVIDLVGKEAAAAREAARQQAETVEKAKAGATREQIKAAGDLAAAAYEFDPARPLEPLKNCVRALPDCNLKECLTVVLNETGAELTEIKASIENWFNSSMDRVAGYYKRHAQKMIFIIAVVVTLSLNLNTVTLTQRLINDSALRKALVAQAEAYVKDNPAPTPAPNTNAVAAVTATGTSTNSPAQRIEQTATVIYGLGLPIGWDHFTTPSSCLEWLGLLAGYLASMFAISLGAPFWFDILNKIIQLRGALTPQAAQKKAAEGKAKEKK